jgi:tripartite-type tricarboxylate transporter receptor subunit TctC
VRDDLKALGFVPKSMMPDQFAGFLHDDMKKWPAIVAASGLSTE